MEREWLHHLQNKRRDTKERESQRDLKQEQEQEFFYFSTNYGVAYTYLEPDVVLAHILPDYRENDRDNRDEQ